tara:strand:- start:48 stop:422 length:375 start_codon:yes stop_codon:yes gene_type:complete
MQLNKKYRYPIAIIVCVIFKISWVALGQEYLGWYASGGAIPSFISVCIMFYIWKLIVGHYPFSKLLAKNEKVEKKKNRIHSIISAIILFIMIILLLYGLFYIALSLIIVFILPYLLYLWIINKK